MAREKIQIDLEAKDNASKQIDKVADKAEALERLDPDVQIGAVDNASDDLREVQDRAEQVGNTSPTVKVGADTSQAEAAIASLVDEAGALPASLTRTVGLIGAGGPAGIAGAAGVAAAGLAAMAKNTADTAIEANALKEAVGGTVEETSTLLAATSRVGLRYNDVLELIAESNKAMTENADEAERLGVNLSGTPIERFQQLVDLVYQIPDPLERSRVASKFFGEEGSKQLPRLIGLYGDLTSAIESVDASQILSQDDVDNAIEFSQAFADIQAQLNGFIVAVGTQLIPIINLVGESLGIATAAANDEDGLGGVLLRSVPIIGGTINAWEGLAGAFESGASTMDRFRSVAAGAAGQVPILGGAFASVVGPAEDAEDALRRGGEGAFAAAGQHGDAAREIGDVWEELGGRVGDAAKDAAEAIKEQDDALKSLNDTFRESMALNGDIDRATDDFLDSVNSLEEDLKAATEAATDDADAQRNRGLVVRDAMDKGIRAAEILEQQTLAQMGLTRETADSNTVTKAQNDALLSVAESVEGPVRDALLFHIQSINNIPEDVATEIVAAIAEGDLARAQTLLDDATRDRDLSIKPELAGEQEFENQLDHLTRERQMYIRGILSGTVPLEGDSLHLTDLETGQEKGVIPHEMTLELNVDAGAALQRMAEMRAATEAARQAAKDAGQDFTSSIDVLEDALSDLSQLRDVDGISQEEYLQHLYAHLAGYEKFSEEWFAITERITRVEGEAARERQRQAEEAAQERKRLQDQEAAERQRFVDQVRSEFAGAEELISEFGGEERVTSAGITSFIAAEAAKARKFAFLISQLQSTALSPSVIEALVQAGPDASNVAFALTQASPLEIRRINAALFDLFKTGGATAAAVGRLLGIPGFQHGGVFQAPTTGGAGLAVLHDGETVVPKGKTAGVTYNQRITVNARQDIATTIEQMRRYTRRNGEIRVS